MNLFDKLRRSAADAGRKAQTAVEINRLRTQIGDLREQMDDKLHEMGEAVYEAYRVRDLALAERPIDEISRDIQALEQEVEKLEYRIHQYKNERQCSCGAVAPLGAKFCPECGNRFGELAVVVEEEPEETLDTCPSCKEEIEEETKFCMNCGFRLARDTGVAAVYSEPSNL
ncbi:zinc ribbon domain-containing protein [Paenibacillus swuensis]|uniref:zinc ribbon domain-containing protein n=1 Tax=Paenibacillus swuensis TaxID=1178515 RepID=UPI0008396656|nr:zinc ribbon domain-containing protein [Paenibacillus swuensis]